jgi:DNA topoisomerase-1
MLPNHDTRRSARAAGLRYISDERLPGITRHGAPGRFHYKRPDGSLVRDKSTLNRIKALVIPPAWKNVWIAPFANAHLMATGRDARGRKQYRYHPAFAAVRDANKYAHLAHFAASLPAIRRRLKADMARPGLPREKILATIVTLLEGTLIRIGNEDYARANNSFGLTTLRNRHVKVKGAELRFLFKGKSGKQWSLSVQDRRVARVIRSCQELPGQHLFEYRSDDGAIHAVSSTDVNNYLREIAGTDISAKDFRTWAGTVKAAMALRDMGEGGRMLCARWSLPSPRNWATPSRSAASATSTPRSSPRSKLAHCDCACRRADAAGSAPPNTRCWLICAAPAWPKRPESHFLPQNV